MGIIICRYLVSMKRYGFIEFIFLISFWNWSMQFRNNTFKYIVYTTSQNYSTKTKDLYYGHVEYDKIYK